MFGVLNIFTLSGLLLLLHPGLFGTRRAATYFQLQSQCTYRDKGFRLLCKENISAICFFIKNVGKILTSAMACQCCKHISQSLGNGSIAVGTHYGVVVFGMKKEKGSIRRNVQHIFAPVLEHGKYDALALVWVVKLSDVKLRPLQHGSLVCGKCSSSTHAVYSLVRKAL